MGTSKKKILLVIPNLDFGGAQLSFARLSQLLARDYSVSLAVFNKKNIAPLMLHGDLHDLDVNAGRSYFGKIYQFFLRVIRLRKLKAKLRPHFSISFLEGADYVNILSSVGEKIFLYQHGSKIFDRNVRGIFLIIRKFLVSVLYARANRILVVNDRLRIELMEHFGLVHVEYSVMPNFYDIDEMNSLASEPIPDELQTVLQSYPTFCISGRIAPEKGIDRFLQIFPFILQNVDSRIKLIIVGDGMFKEEIFRICKVKNILFTDLSTTAIDCENLPEVFFAGYQNNPFKFLSHCKALLLPSLNEGMPNTVVEAMCIGIPVIAADCPYGPRELLSNESEQKLRRSWPEFVDFGILLPVLQNEHEVKEYWAEAIRRLINDHNLCKHYQIAGRQRSILFSKDRNVVAWKELLETSKA